MNHLSKKDFLFGILIFALAIAISLLQPTNKIIVEFDDSSVDIKSSRYTMNIPYDMVTQITLADKPDMGALLDGHDDMILQTGTWHNDAWGDYTACVEIATDNCIVIHLNNGSIFVISRRDNEETAKVYEAFLTHLP